MQRFQKEDQELFEAIEEYRSGNKNKATFIYESTKKYAYKIVHYTNEKTFYDKSYSKKEKRSEEKYADRNDERIYWERMYDNLI